MVPKIELSSPKDYFILIFAGIFAMITAYSLPYNRVKQEEVSDKYNLSNLILILLRTG